MLKHGPSSDAMNVRFSIGGVIPLNIPNSLTILRILLIPVIVGFLLYGYVAYALATLIVAALTDALDGSIARMANQRTRFGAYLDPLADKLLLMTTFITLTWLEVVPVWSMLVVVSRDVILLTGGLLARLTDAPLDTTPTASGKAAMLFQVCYILLVLVCIARGVDTALLLPLLYVMILLTILSGLQYIVRGIGHLHASEGS